MVPQRNIMSGLVSYFGLGLANNRYKLIFIEFTFICASLYVYDAHNHNVV